MPPASQSYVAPIGDAALEYTADATLYLPRHSGSPSDGHRQPGDVLRVPAPGGKSGAGASESIGDVHRRRAGLKRQAGAVRRKSGGGQPEYGHGESGRDGASAEPGDLYIRLSGHRQHIDGTEGDRLCEFPHRRSSRRAGRGQHPAHGFLQPEPERGSGFGLRAASQPPGWPERKRGGQVPFRQCNAVLSAGGHAGAIERGTLPQLCQPEDLGHDPADHAGAEQGARR